MASESSIRIPTLSVEGYRAFRDRSELELRPLTLLFGRNQAGKSTLLRLLVAIADSVFGQARVLDMTSPALLGSTFKELGWLGPDPSFSPRLRLTAPDSRAFFEVQLTDENGVAPNRILLGRREDPPDLDVSLEDVSPAGPQQFHAEFAGRANAVDWTGPLEFNSLLPTIPDTEQTRPAIRRLAEVRGCLEALRGIQWLSATRPQALANSRRARCCLPDGRDLPSALQGRPDVMALASHWLSEVSGLAESVAIGRDPTGLVRLELKRIGQEALPFHLAGEGLQWLLPNLLCACWAECGGAGAPTMLAIEEVEARLHPNLQIALLERLIDTVRKGIPCVLETHSIYLLRRVQLAVLEQRLTPQDVAIHWVERDGHAARVRRIHVEGDGTLKGWHPETFEEEQQLNRQIFQARWRAHAAPPMPAAPNAMGNGA